jgi:DNA-binding Xre family transcriptional regulator
MKQKIAKKKLRKEISGKFNNLSSLKKGKAIPVTGRGGP